MLIEKVRCMRWVWETMKRGLSIIENDIKNVLQKIAIEYCEARFVIYVS